MKTIEIKFQENDQMHQWQAPAGMSLVQALNQVLIANRKCENLLIHHVAIKREE